MQEPSVQATADPGGPTYYKDDGPPISRHGNRCCDTGAREGWGQVRQIFDNPANQLRRLTWKKHGYRSQRHNGQEEDQKRQSEISLGGYGNDFRTVDDSPGVADIVKPPLRVPFKTLPEQSLHCPRCLRQIRLFLKNRSNGLGRILSSEEPFPRDHFVQDHTECPD